MNKPLVIGHRGAMGHETENTLASIKKALDLGVDMIEIDVFKIKSGEIVVFHDVDVQRLTNESGDIEAFEFDELQNLVVEGGHKIPTLQQVIDVIDKKSALNIELKGAGTSANVKAIMNNNIEENGWQLDDFIISSFNWEELKVMRAINEKVAIAILTEENPVDAIPIAKELQAIAINPYFKDLDLEVANTIREAGFKIYTWTVNEPNDINEMKRSAVDGIITNFPERVH
jgi:glycerophosphoryl diester phosphodiesterase